MFATQDIMDPRFMRYKAEMMHTSAFGMVFATVTLVDAAVTLCDSITKENQDWSGSMDTFPQVLRLLGALVQATFSMSCLFVFLMWLLEEKCSNATAMMNAMWTTIGALFSFFVYLSYISFVGNHFDETGFQYFIPPSFLPTNDEVRSVAGLSSLIFIAYYANLYVGLGLFAWKAWEFGKGNWTNFNRGYYKTRMLFFGFMSAWAGVFQIALGSYLEDKYGTGYLDEGGVGGTVVASGPVVVTFPAITTAVGCLLLVHGCYAMMRGFNPSEGVMFDMWSFFVWTCILSLQIFSNMAFAEPPLFAYQTLVAQALWLMPMYCDMKARNTPAEVASDYFAEMEMTKEAPVTIGEEHKDPDVV